MTEIAEAEKISKSYVSRILRLALLAPDIVEAILGGWADQRVILEKLERPLPMGWEEQRRAVSGRCSAMANRKELRNPPRPSATAIEVRTSPESDLHARGPTTRTPSRM